MSFILPCNLIFSILPLLSVFLHKKIGILCYKVSLSFPSKRVLFNHFLVSLFALIVSNFERYSHPNLMLNLLFLVIFT